MNTLTKDKHFAKFSSRFPFSANILGRNVTKSIQDWINNLLHAQTSSYRAAIEKLPTHPSGWDDQRICIEKKDVMKIFTEGKE